MPAAQILNAVAVLAIVLGVALTILGALPVTRARVGDTLGWGVTLLVLGIVLLLLLLLLVG
jgi:hypothetical protein